MRYMVLAVLAAAHFSAACAEPTPEGAAEAFYRWVLAQKNGGLPSPQQRAQLTQFVAAQLIRDLEATSATERQCVASTAENMKPPIWEGNIFVGNYEGATDVAYSKPHGGKRVATINVDLVDAFETLPRGDRGRAVFWRDRIKLRKEKAGWVVVDVIRNGSGSLSAELREYVAIEGKRCRRQAKPLGHLYQPIAVAQSPGKSK